MDGRSKFGFTTMTQKSSLQPLGTPARPSVTSFRHDVVFRNMSVRTQCNCRSKTEQRHCVCPAPSLDGTSQKKAWQNFTWCFLRVLCSVRTASRIFYLQNNRAAFFHPIRNQAILCCASGIGTFQIRCKAKPLP